jgi:hypothetical protein
MGFTKREIQRQLSTNEKPPKGVRRPGVFIRLGGIRAATALPQFTSVVAVSAADGFSSLEGDRALIVRLQRPGGRRA